MGRIPPPSLRNDSTIEDAYDAIVPIRTRGAFRLAAARHRATGEPGVLVLPGVTATRGPIVKAFDEIARVHALLDHPGVPKVARRGSDGDTPFLELACDAAADGIDLLRRLGESGRLVPYVAADGFIVSLRETLQAAHRTHDPTRGGPICLGRISLGNILVNRRGERFLVGFGHNFPIERDTGGLDGSTACFEAPELAFGGAPSPMGDYVALLLLSRSLVPHIGFPPRIKALLGDDGHLAQSSLVRALRWADQRVLLAHPRTRPTLEEAIAAADRLRRLLGAYPDRAGFGALAAELLATGKGDAPLSSAAPTTVTLGPQAAWVVSPSGERSKLTGPLRRLFLALSEHRLAHPGAALTIWQLLEAG